MIASLYHRLATIAFIAIAFGACDSLPGRPKPADLPLRPSAIADFSQLYSENCAGCHGADGKFGPALALNNPIYLAIADDVSIRRTVANGVSGTAMPPFALSAGGSLTDKQIDILIDGMRKSWAGAADLAGGAPPYASNVRHRSGSGRQRPNGRAGVESTRRSGRWSIKRGLTRPMRKPAAVARVSPA